MKEIKKFKRVLVANRGEIAIRVFRACQEMGIRTVAIYSEEDKKSLFRTKADESYQIGKGKAPVAAYLGIDEIIDLAKAKGVDAIHPGYGFLSENVEFAEACEAAGIEFIGPTSAMMDRLGDKIKSKIVANEVGVPTIPGVDAAIRSEEEAAEFAEKCGYPVMLKAAAGGGGRGMGSDIYFWGLSEGETCEVKLAEGKILVIKLIEIRDVNPEGFRELVFEVNGNRRVVKIKDNDVQEAVSSASTRYADEENPLEIGSNIPGNIVKILVNEGETVTEKQPIAVVEAMKMETNILSTAAGEIEKIFVKAGQQVKAGELIAMKVACPSLAFKDGKAYIADVANCTGCGLCMQNCKVGAIKVVE